jgi:hypothetical protein
LVVVVVSMDGDGYSYLFHAHSLSKGQIMMCHRAIVGWLLFAFCPCQAAPPETVRPLVQAHAHNDYAHARPLLDALDHGFCNVEADVFLVDGQLLVGHGVEELKPDRTLERLYLQPLLDRVNANRGSVYPQGPEFTLMIDFKSAAEPTYEALSKTLAGYQKMLTSVHDGQVERRAVTIVISGNRPIDKIRNERMIRWTAIDGRPSDLDSDLPAHLLPWISDSWSKHFKWNGVGEMPADEHQKLRSLVERAHQRGRRIRFWGAPDREEAWKTLADAKVDLINTDDLAGLAKFLNQRKK